MAKNFSHLVVGVDFSKYSPLIVKQAEKLASTLCLDLVFVHVLDIAQASGSVPQVLQEEFEESLRADLKLPQDSKIIVRSGKAFEQIHRVAKKFPSALILVGHRSQMGAVKRLILGSTAERVALHSSVPVWIHMGEKTVMPEKILIPCDMSERTVNTIKGVKSLNFCTKPKVEYLHIMEPPAPVLDYETWSGFYKKIKQQDDIKLRKFKKAHPKLKILKTVGTVVEAIAKKAKAFDVIAVSPRSHKGAFPGFGSVTSKIVKHGSTPVLVIP